MHWCDSRLPKSELAKQFPHFIYPEDMPEEDEMFDPDLHESVEHVAERVRSVMETVWSEAGEAEECELGLPFFPSLLRVRMFCRPSRCLPPPRLLLLSLSSRHLSHLPLRLHARCFRRSQPPELPDRHWYVTFAPALPSSLALSSDARLSLLLPFFFAGEMVPMVVRRVPIDSSA